MAKYYLPTTLLSGINCIKRHPRHMVRGCYAMVVTGKQSAVVSGALKDVTDVLEENGVKYEIYNEVSSSTDINDIYSLGQLMKQKGMDYVIGIGGGSTLDAAKSAAVYAANNMGPMDIYEEHYEKTPLPVVCVPTTAGTGSDTTQYVMLTLPDGTKKSYSAEECFPYASFLDSRYTRTMPVEVSRNTAIDALCHAIESYLNSSASPFSDIVALEAIRLIGKTTDALVSGNFSEEDRENLLVAAAAGGMAVAYTGLNVVHAMGHQLTVTHNIPHGRANGVLLTEYIAWVAKKDPLRAVKVLDAFGSDLTSFKRFIDAVLPTTEEFTEEDVDEWINTSIVSTVAESCPREITAEDERQIYNDALIDKKLVYFTW